MRHLHLGLILGLSASTFACGGSGAGSSSASLTFGAPTLSMCADGTAGWVRAGDFNGDGHADLLVGCEQGSSAAVDTVLLNQGDGTFAAPVGGVSGDLVVDVNGDGRDDVIDDVYQKIYFANVDGTFAKPVATSIPSVGCDVSQDWDGDGWKDALCYDYKSTVEALSFNADGSTTRIFSVTVPRHPSGADLNGDGKLDLVYASGSSIIVQLNLGAGNFSSPQAIVTMNETLSSPTFADLDGDGYVDMMVAAGSSSSGYTYCLFHNKSGTGFEAWPQFPGVADVTYKLQDVTADGIADMVLLSQGPQLMVLVGKGDGTFDTNSDPLNGPWSRTVTALFQDLNGDGKLDLVVPDGAVNVLLQQ